MKPRIEYLSGKQLIGKRLVMSLSNNKTSELWKSFMPRQKEILNNVGSELYSIQVYNRLYFSSFNPDVEFEKWAAIEVTDIITVPAEMESFILPGGLYAVFLYKGATSKGSEIFNYIFGTWLPNSEYVLDDRPHFEILGEKYKNEDPDSEEEIWIPIREKF
jgi:AraC family transcriptional regulator